MVWKQYVGHRNHLGPDTICSDEDVTTDPLPTIQDGMYALLPTSIRLPASSLIQLAGPSKSQAAQQSPAPSKLVPSAACSLSCWQTRCAQCEGLCL